MPAAYSEVFFLDATINTWQILLDLQREVERADIASNAHDLHYQRCRQWLIFA